MAAVVQFAATAPCCVKAAAFSTSSPFWKGNGHQDDEMLQFTVQGQRTTESKEMRIKNPLQNFRGCMEGGTGLANKFAGIETSKCIMQAMALGGAAARRP